MAKPKRNRSFDLNSFDNDNYMDDLYEDETNHKRNKKNIDSKSGLSKKDKRELKANRRKRQNRGDDFFNEEK